MKRRMLAVGALTSLAVAGPITAAQGASSRANVTQGVVYGAVTSQSFAVMIELSKTGRKVVKAAIGLDLKCQVPPDITIPDGVTNIPVSAAGKFQAEQAETVPADPVSGVPRLDVTAKLTGQVNKARTRIIGTWTRKVVIYNPADPTGVAIADTCDSGLLRFTAKN